MSVYGYARVSTDRQAKEGESLEVQQRTITGYALMHDLALASFYVERGVSGSLPLRDRPEGEALLAVLKPGDIVITAKLDRMFRSALDALDVLAKLKDRGVSLHMIDLGGDVTSNGMSKMVFTILAAVAEAERDRIGERIIDVKKDQRKRHRYLGGKLPFGFEVGEKGKLVEIAEQQQAIRRATELKAEGRTLRAIQAELAAGGTALSLAALHRLLGERCNVTASRAP